MRLSSLLLALPVCFCLWSACAPDLGGFSSDPQASAVETASTAGAAAEPAAAGAGASTTGSNPGAPAVSSQGAGASASATAGSSARPGPPGDQPAQAGAAGSSRATPTAAAGSGSPASVCTATLCESFEASSGEALDPNWEVSTTNCMGTGTVTTDSTLAHTGTRSVRVNGGGGYCNHVFFRPKLSPWKAAAPQPIYARFFVRFDKPLTQSHVTFLALRDESEMKDLRMGGQSEILMWNRESDDATLPELSPTGIAASAKAEPGKWLCVEFLVDGQSPKLETWLNGEPVKGLVVEGEPTPDVDAQWQRKADWRPSLSDIRFGWESYGGDENTLWFDDVALGSSRVGCGP